MNRVSEENELIKVLEEEVKSSKRLSQACWEDGDKPNSHFQEGRAVGIAQATFLVKQYGGKEAQR